MTRALDLDGLAAVVSDAEVERVHGHANFGAMSKREVVNDGVRKYAVGYEGGWTQLNILMEHGLVTTPRLGSYAANLTKKGKKYARALYQIDNKAALAAAHERDGLRGEARAAEGRAQDYRTVAINQGWNWSLCDAYGREAYAAHRGEHVDACALNAAETRARHALTNKADGDER